MLTAMWLVHLDNIPQAVITEYGPILAGLKWFPASGGFSGAYVWRGEDAQGIPRVALKRWPMGTTENRLAQIHAWMDTAAHLPFVPRVVPTRFGSEVATETSIGGPSLTTHSQYKESECISFLWDATSWQPGLPHIPANASEIEIACESVAELHVSWSRDQVIAPSSGISRRIEVLSQWISDAKSTIPQRIQSWRGIILHACEVVDRIAPFVLKALIPWQNVSFHLQPCMRDLRGEHVLFQDGVVTGIVDFGAMDVDTPALDVARLLGDLTAENDELFALGLEKYRDFRHDIHVEKDLVEVLDQAGITCSIIGWLARISSQDVRTSTKKVEARLFHLLARAEKFNPI
jgi:hypothetical protein